MKMSITNLNMSLLGSIVGMGLMNFHPKIRCHKYCIRVP
jgi:hypothetical protein